MLTWVVRVARRLVAMTMVTLVRFRSGSRGAGRGVGGAARDDGEVGVSDDDVGGDDGDAGGRGGGGGDACEA